MTESLAEALDEAALDARSPRPVVLVGSRGVGKTVLLDEARSIAAQRHAWISADVEVPAHGPLVPEVVRSLTAAQHLYDQSSPGERWTVEKASVRASLAGIGGSAELVRTRSDDDTEAQVLALALERTMAAALAKGAGLLLTLDKVHLASRDDLSTVAALLQRAVGRDWPLVTVMAGLPTMRDPRRMVTYLERCEWHELGLLAETDAREGLARPALEAGRPMDDDAADALAQASGGYPYAVQVLGHHAWRASHGAERITLAHAHDGEEAARRDFAGGLFSARWDDLSPREREYVRVLARLLVDGSAPNGSDVARALGQPPTSLTYLRARLLQKGTIFTTAGTTRFAVPGMAEWITGQDMV